MKKTKKEFTPYNDYEDRPFDLKWPTAFPLGELQAVIKETDEFSAREIERLPQQSQVQIEYLLDRSIKQNKVLEIQLNSLDNFNRVKPHVFGAFRGMAELDVVLIGDFQIDFFDIRHIKIHNFLKWSAIEILEDSFADVELPELTDEEQKSFDVFFKEYYDDGEFYK